MRVALFITCLADHFFADAGTDAVRLLRHLGCEVVFPEGQTCCGQPAHNAGLSGEATRMAAHTARVLSGSEPVVLPSGSCAAMIAREYPALGAGSGLSDRTWELGAFVHNRLGARALGRGLEGRRIAFHQGCHALRQLGLEAESIELLRGAGAEVVDWPTAAECCGFGGLFSAKV
ncbi:MAG: (Fe-S)-binding protein, partial [Gemmatimonadetes bacterium]|nr:(Fe-S)-binding protein [Gemmatimonadota bacterium]